MLFRAVKMLTKGARTKKKSVDKVTQAPRQFPKAVNNPTQKVRAARKSVWNRIRPTPDKDHVAAYIHIYRKLPPNYITKAEARSLGWKDKGTLDQVAPGKSIGGDRFSNYEKILPDAPGRSWKECDIDYVRGNRNAKRICFSNDGLIYYTSSHYQDFEKIY